MARRGFQQGSLFQRGTRRKLWVARWWDDVIQADGTLGRLRRSEVIGSVAEFPTRRLAMQVLSQRLGSINNGKARPQSVRTFGDFVKDDWTPVVLPTLKYATQKHYRYMLDVHLNPAFGKRQLRELTREELQSFLSRKLSNGLSWETVHHFKCGLSKILGVRPLPVLVRRLMRPTLGDRQACLYRCAQYHVSGCFNETMPKAGRKALFRYSTRKGHADLLMGL